MMSSHHLQKTYCVCISVFRRLFEPFSEKESVFITSVCKCLITSSNSFLIIKDKTVTDKPQIIYKMFFTGKALSFGKPEKGMNAIKMPRANIVEIFIIKTY